jgi:Neuraminidase-like domain/Salmonella virulence plasmid 28.1kDa A protein
MNSEQPRPSRSARSARMRESAALTIRGTLVDAQMTPLPKTVVAAFSQQLHGRPELAHTETDSAGGYEIRLAPPDHDSEKEGAEHHPAAVNLVIQALSPDRVVLAESPVHYNATGPLFIDLVVGGGTYRGPSEFERLASVLKLSLNGAGPAALTTDEIGFLSHTTGLSAARITAFAGAGALGAQTGIVSEAFYALAAAGLPLDLAKLYGVSPSLQRGALQVALDNNTIPARLGPDLDAILKQLQDSAVRAALATATNGHPNLGSLLATTALDTTQQADLLTRFAQHDGPIEDFWNGLARDPAYTQGSTIPDLQFTFQAGALAMNHTPLVTELLRLRAAQQITSLRDLARFTEGDWKGLILGSDGTNGTGVPVEITGATPDQRATTYAQIITRVLDDAFPTAAITRQIGEQPQSTHADVHNFLVQNQYFDFSTEVIDHYIADNPAALTTVQDPTGTTQQLKAFQRVFRLSPRFDHMSALLDDGIHSAHQVTRMGRTQFTAQYAPALGGPGPADIVYARAAHITATAQHLYADFNLQLNGALPAAIATTAPDTRHIPDLEALFGSLDFCACSDCRSVLSPAAYLVDILHFLRDRQTLDGTQSAKDLLFARRPDLGEVELTCENTNTPLPYTDLVNEILESAVSPLAFTLSGALTADLQSGGATTALIQAFGAHGLVLTTGATIAPQTSSSVPSPFYIVRDPGWRHVVIPSGAGFDVHPYPQTSAGAEELAANPEHLNSAAYDVLSAAVYPWLLPLNLWSETARAYLGHLGVSRDTLMAALAPGDPPSEAVHTAIASEALGLTTLERGLIAGTTSHSAGELWGFTNPAPANWVDVVAIVRAFELRSGLTSGDLLDLLAAQYVNPGATMSVKSIDLKDPLTCDTTKLKITQLTADALDRIHRFVRLARALNWAFADLDIALTLLGPGFADGGGKFKEPFVDPFALILQLQKQSNLAVDQILSLWYPINTAGASPLYGRLFQNPVVLKPLDPAFALNATGTELAIVSDNPAQAKLSLHSATILASLSIAAKDLAAITTLDITDDALTLANLTEIYRVSLLAQVTGLAIQDVLRLRDISGVNPFDPAKAVDTAAFIRLAARVQSLGFSIDELDYLLRDQSFPGAAVAPLDQNVALILDDIYGGLLKTPNPAPNPVDPTGVLTRAALSQLPEFTDTLLDQAMGLIAGTSVDLPATQNAFIDAHFVSFLDPTTAKAKLVGPPPSLTAAPDRYSYVLFALQTSATIAARRNVIKQKLSVALTLQPKMVDQLLTRTITSTKTPGSFAMDDFLALASITKADPKQPLTPADCPDQISTYDLLVKVVMVLLRFKVRPEQLAWLGSYGPAVGWLDLNALPTTPQPSAGTLFTAWQRTADLFALRDALPSGSDTLGVIFTMARDASVTETALLTELAHRTRWSLDDLQALSGSAGLNLTYPAAFQDERGIARLHVALAPLKRLGVDAVTAQAWVKPDLTSGDARTIVQTVKAKYDDETWNAVARPLRDVLREKQRAVLVAYLLARPDAGLDQSWTTTNEMFDWYLIDIEMTPAMVTSRIKQAISSTQLHTQRIRMNLQAGIVADLTADDAWGHWAWMKNYRVWEANRQVFLFPENWVEPELRDGKTPEFLTLENEILKNSLTDSLAGDAIIQYLESLDAIARLEICGMYHQVDLDNNGNRTLDLMHVFGRTYGGKPQHYYYRRWDAISGFWSAWQKVDLDIETQHLVPIVYDGRLFLFWSIFTKSSNSPAFTMPSPGDTVPQPPVYWDIAIAYSVLHNKKWSAKKLCVTSLTYPPTPVDWPTLGTTYDPISFTFRPTQYYGSQLVYCYWFQYTPPPPQPPK